MNALIHYRKSKIPRPPGRRDAVVQTLPRTLKMKKMGENYLLDALSFTKIALHPKSSCCASLRYSDFGLPKSELGKHKRH